MSEDDGRNLEAITQNVHFFSFLSHQKPHFHIVSQKQSHIHFLKGISEKLHMRDWNFTKTNTKGRTNKMCCASCVQVVLLPLRSCTKPWGTDCRALVVPHGNLLSLSF